jgi:shikimate 5-dehydrogenase/3-dehydroquinate dehydratase
VILTVTIHEPTPKRALEAIRALDPSTHDMVELRVDAFNGTAIVASAFSAATPHPLLVTNRGGIVESEDADLIDVEWPPKRRVDRAWTVLSHHDFNGIPDDLETIVETMLSFGCVHTKLALTPRNFADNLRLLDVLRRHHGLTIFGMGERGLYSRVLAPFLGSPLTFVSPDDRAAAPGQLSLERATAIYGDRRLPHDPNVFAVVGNPAGHSLSPSIHNPLFRQFGLPAAYTIASIERFDEITPSFLNGEPCGLSITAPFKEDALRFAESHGAAIGEFARRAGAANTLVNTPRGIAADNTDVDAFLAALDAAPRTGRIAIAGAGGTARAAIVACEERGIAVDVYNRTPKSLLGQETKPLEQLAGTVIINTLPAGVPLRLPNAFVIAAGYPSAAHFDGIQLLKAQAQRQNEMFRQVFSQ